MSVTVPAQGTLRQPDSLLLPDTAVNDVLALAAGRTDIVTVIGIVICNRDSSARKVTVWWTKDSTDYAIYESSVSANSTVTIALDAPIQLYAKSTARKIKAQAAAGSVVTVTVISTGASQQDAR